MAAIENYNTQSLFNESFSYSWLVNLTPGGLEDSFRVSIDASDEASFIEMDPKLPPSKRFFKVPKDLNFDFPTSDSSSSNEIHADQLIYNGYLMPIFVKQAKKEPYGCEEPVSGAPVSSGNRKEVKSCTRFRCASLRKCRRLSRRILEKYFEFLRPLCEKMRWDNRSGSKPGNCVSKGKVHRQKVKKCENSSPGNSPRSSAAYSVDNWRRSCDSESSIHEAVLHCKRNIGK